MKTTKAAEEQAKRDAEAEAERKKLAEERAAIDAERAKIEAEKQAEADRKAEAERIEMERLKEEAAEVERKYQEDQRKKERDALVPDLEKFRDYMKRMETAFKNVEGVTVKDEYVKSMVMEFDHDISHIFSQAEDRIDTMAS